VTLDLRAVVLVAGVRDRQLGELEGIAYLVELGLGGHAQTEPAEPVTTTLRSQLLDRVGFDGPAALDVPRSVDDHDTSVAPFSVRPLHPWSSPI
jgi:hypothetical protein